MTRIGGLYYATRCISCANYSDGCGCEGGAVGGRKVVLLSPSDHDIHVSIHTASHYIVPLELMKFERGN